MRPRRLPASLALLILPSLAPPSAAAQSDTAGLRRSLEGILRGSEGVAGVSIQNLATGEALSIRGGEKFPTASLIKVAVLVGVMDEVRRGTIRLDDPITMIAWRPRGRQRRAAAPAQRPAAHG
jgi:beta-lactamase class A